MQIFLQTPRLFFRNFEPSDLEVYHSLTTDPKSTQYQSWVPKSIIESKEFLFKSMEDAHAIPRESYCFAVVYRSTGQCIGSAGIHISPTENQDAEFGYTLSSEYSGMGLGSEMAIGLVEFVFNDLNLNRLWGIIHPENIPSIKILEKLNFKKEGVLQEGMNLRGQFVDCFLYGKTKRSFLKDKNSDALLEEGLQRGLAFSDNSVDLK
ncbi:MAG: hypothetical protein CL677_09075 [Bdellovibrionaceae bacterium]|nr:hypothetical protein [Pseudobdellovibrionaceae bacterium]|tara:strand:+ start:69019 stop:69639 length:621 start_codon:yes stop_codon:yes gene_type:complete